MRMFRNRNRSVPDLNTSSLPDLIFTVLFFFMIVTHMRDMPLIVKTVVPQGSGLVKAAKKSVVNIVIGYSCNHIGESADASSPAAYSIQVNGKVVGLEQLASAIETERRQMPPEAMAEMTVNLRADRHTPMSVIGDVRKVLRQSYALKVFYSANEEDCGNPSPMHSRKERNALGEPSFK